MYKIWLVNIIEIEDSATFECTTEEDKSVNIQDENEQFDNEYHKIFEDYSCSNFNPLSFTQSINDS